MQRAELYRGRNDCFSQSAANPSSISMHKSTAQMWMTEDNRQTKYSRVSCFQLDIFVQVDCRATDAYRFQPANVLAGA